MLEHLHADDGIERPVWFRDARDIAYDIQLAIVPLLHLQSRVVLCRGIPSIILGHITQMLA
jgi:hypothetical protein